MTMTSTAEIATPLSAAADPAKINFVAATRFMESIEVVRPVVPGATIRLCPNTTGMLDVYSVGTANTLHRIRAQAGAYGAWAEEDLGLVLRRPSVFPRLGLPDNPTIMGIAGDGSLNLCVYDGTSRRYTQVKSQPANAKAIVNEFLGVELNGVIYANVLLNDGVVASSFLENGAWASRDWVPLKDQDGGADFKGLKIAMCGNDLTQTHLYAIGQDKYVYFAETPYRFSAFRNLGYLTAQDLHVVRDAENLLNIFIVCATDQLVYVKRQRKYSPDGRIDWEDWQKVPGTARARNVKAVLNPDGRVQVFMIADDAHGTLYVSRETKDRGRRTGWTELFPLGTPVPNAMFEVAQNGDGYAEAFTTVRPAEAQAPSSMCRFWQNTETTQWFSEVITIHTPESTVRVPSHSVEIQVADDQGAALPQTDVEIRTSMLCTLRVNGQSFQVSPLDVLRTKSNIAGKLVITYPTTSLTGPSLLLRTPAMPAGESVRVEPNIELQERLHAMSADEILSARRADGSPLLPGEGEQRRANAEAITEATRRSMSIGFPPQQISLDTPPRLRGNASLAGLAYHPPSSADTPFRLDPATVPEQHWRLSFHDDGAIRFEELTREHAAKLSAEASVRLFGFDWSWGDVMTAFKNGVGFLVDGLKEIVVTTVINPITKLVEAVKVTFDILVDGVIHTIETIIDKVQMVFDLIETIWAKVKAFFVDLYNWLAFLFAFDDIRRTAAAVRHSLNVALDFSVLGIQAVKKTIGDGMDNLSGQVKNAADALVGALGGNDQLGQLVKVQEDPKTKLMAERNAAHNVLLNAYMDNWEGTKVKQEHLVRMERMVGADSPLAGLIEKLQALGNNFQFGDGTAAFDEAVAYFKQIGDNPQDAVRLALKGVIRAMESVALFGIAAAKGVILSVLDLVAELVNLMKEILNAEWEIPIVSQIYEVFTGEKLTLRMIDLGAYCIAIPGTILHKIIRGKAPFPDDATLAWFEQTFTADWLAAQAGLKTGAAVRSTAPPVLPGSAALAPQEIIGPIFGVLGGITFMVRVLFETGNIASVAAAKLAQQPNLPFAPETFGLMNVLGRYAQSVFSIPWALKQNAGGLDCSSAEGLSNVEWLCQIILGPSVNGLLIIANRFANNKIPTEVADIAQTLWGAAHLTMVGVLISRDAYPNGFLAARAIMANLAPQALRFALIGQLVVASKGISAVILQVVVVLTLPANAVITFKYLPFGK